MNFEEIKSPHIDDWKVVYRDIPDLQIVHVGVLIDDHVVELGNVKLEDNVAKAHLMASAPKLLIMLEKLYGYAAAAEISVSALDEALAVINEAKREKRL